MNQCQEEDFREAEEAVSEAEAVFQEEAAAAFPAGAPAAEGPTGAVLLAEAFPAATEAPWAGDSLAGITITIITITGACSGFRLAEGGTTEAGEEAAAVFRYMEFFLSSPS